MNNIMGHVRSPRNNMSMKELVQCFLYCLHNSGFADVHAYDDTKLFHSVALARPCSYVYSS